MKERLSSKEESVPQAELYSDHSKESDNVRELLHEREISFNDWISPEDFKAGLDFQPPILNAREGQFLGIEGISWYVDLVAGDKPLSSD